MQLCIKNKLIISRNLLLYLFDLITLSYLKSNKKTITKYEVVLIRLDAIGDFVLWLDSARNLRSIYKKNLLLVGNSQWIELAKHFNYWDECIELDTVKFSKNLFYRFRKLKVFSKISGNKVLHPTYSRVYESGDSVVRSIDANEKIGYIGDYLNISQSLKKISNRWYTKLVENIESDIHELQKNNTFVETISGVSFTCNLPKISRINISVPYLEKNRKEYFIIAPGSSWVGRVWPEKNFSEIINYVVKKYGLEPVLTGAKSEFELCERIANLSGVRCKNLSGKTTLPQLIEITRGAKFVIGNESSTVHVAAAVNTTAFCIVGGGHFNRFVPYPEVTGKTPEILAMKMSCFNCNWKCTKSYDRTGPVPCIEDIKIEKVMDLIQGIIHDKKYQ